MTKAIYDLSTGQFYSSQGEAARTLGIQQAEISRSMTKGKPVRSHLFVDEENWLVWTAYIIRKEGFTFHPSDSSWCVQMQPITKIIEKFISDRNSLPGIPPLELREKDNEYLRSMSQPTPGDLS